MYYLCKATRNSRSGIPGNSRESRTPKFPAGIPGNFWNSGGNYGEFREYCLFFQFLLLIVTVVFNLTAFWAKPWMTSLTQLFWFIELRYTFKYWYRKITEQRQNFANSDHYTNEDAEIILIYGRPSLLHSSAWDGRCSKKGVGEAVSGGRLSWGGRLLIQRWSIAAGQSRHMGRMESSWWH